MCSGTAFKAGATESRSRPQVLHTMATAMTSPVSGSSHSQPVKRIPIPATTTPSDTAASAARCRNEQRHGVREHAVYRLDQHEGEIQADAQRESPARMARIVRTVVVVVCHSRILAAFAAGIPQAGIP